MASSTQFRCKTVEDLQQLSHQLGVDLPISENTDALFASIEIDGCKLPNRLVVQPMEGFDANPDGSPGPLTHRRYERFACGGSGLIWFEATSVSMDGRSNPRQLMLNPETVDSFADLLKKTRMQAHACFGSHHNPMMILQLTHSGRYSRPHGKARRKVLYRNPWLDPDGIDLDYWTQQELEIVQKNFSMAIQLAQKAGFDGVDIKVSHGYLLHEMLTAYPIHESPFGGDLNNRITMIKNLVQVEPGFLKSIRLNATDLIPYPYGFGMEKDGSNQIDLSEPVKIICLLKEHVPLWNITAGIPYFNPHVNRPFDRPVKGSPVPPEHPLKGVARLIGLASELQKAFPEIPMVGTGYSWLRHLFPYVGAAVIHQGGAQLIGLGRNSIAYPDAPKTLMKKGEIDKKACCLCCSRCTELMRNQQPSGCAIHDRPIYSTGYQSIIKTI